MKGSADVRTASDAFGREGAPSVSDPSSARPATTPAAANAMTVDVEDYYQVSAMEPMVDRADWDNHESRVDRNTNRVLDLFAAHEVKATFFTLGWVAERHPALIRRIVSEGHELASHGWAHHRISAQTPEAFRADVRKTKAILQDLSGVTVLGYRAASFSITKQTPWAHAILEDEGYAYSSSIYPIRHDHYGIPDAPRFAYRPEAARALIEVPITTVQLGARRLPAGGGGYFRLLPYGLSRRAITRVNRRDGQPAVFYFHPWEVDPDQPRMPGLSAKTRFRHYTNLSRMQARLDKLLRRFSWTRMDRLFVSGEGK